MNTEMTKEKAKRDLTRGNLFGKLLTYLIPLVLSNILQLLFTTMDLLTVTHFGEGNISSGSIGATNNLINLVLCVFWGITAGVSVVIGNAKGAKDYQKIKKSAGTAVIMMFIASIVVALFGSLMSKNLLTLIGTREVFMKKATTYLTIFFIGAPFNLMFNTGASILRALGDTKRPFLAVVISGIINIGLNLALVNKLDVAGVAIATISSQGIAMLIVFLYLRFDKRLTGNFKLREMRIYSQEAKEILKHGLSNGLQSFIFNFTNVYIQKCVNSLGDACVIGKTAASNIEGYEYTLLNSISATCLVAVSQNFGAKNKKRVISSLLICIAITFVSVTSLDLIIIALNKPLLSLFINQGEETTIEATKIGFSSLLIIGIPYAFCGIAECFTSFLRGMKKPLAPTIVSLVCIVGVRMIFMLFLFKIPFFNNFEWLFGTYPISWVTCCLVYLFVATILAKKTLGSLKIEDVATAPEAVATEK